MKKLLLLALTASLMQPIHAGWQRNMTWGAAGMSFIASCNFYLKLCALNSEATRPQRSFHARYAENSLDLQACKVAACLSFATGLALVCIPYWYQRYCNIDQKS